VKLVVDVRHAFDRRTVEVAFETAGGLTALLGPSGAGKTTTLDVIAGLFRPDHGLVTLDEVTLTDTRRGVMVPPHERHIGYVFQESRLFPHLTVKQNLGFGRWFNRRRANGVGADEVIGLLALEPLLHRNPSRLSGGEKSRVALGRTLLSAPRLLLLDEPLGSVDVGHRQDILPYLDRLIAELSLPMIYVTHERAEIEGRASRIVEMGSGLA
jgi:molybdate transport system ATP-binding protein